LQELQKLFLPGLIGAAVAQLNLAVSRILAFSLQANAISLLYIADRLIDLPLGIFVITLTTLFFPQMSRSSATQQDEEFFQYSLRGILSVLVISMPAAVGLCLLGKEILSVLFAWGQFQVRDVASAVPVLRIFSVALPFYALSTFLTRIYHAKKNTQWPVKASFCAFMVNLLLILLFMPYFQVLGIAWANALAVIFQAFYLRLRLPRIGIKFPFRMLVKPLVGILVSSICMGGVLLLFLPYDLFVRNSSKIHHACGLFLLIFIGIGVYFATLSLWNRYFMPIFLRKPIKGLCH
jgi:putative peptidoglycan lipid II flippase